MSRADATAAKGFHLSVGAGHRLWVSCQGRPDGAPAVFLHGGPGSGCQPGHRRLFDPDSMFAVFVDQRGAGRSLPARARHVNTTADLVADLEQLRAHLGIAKWLVVGGSWGATLALAYAQAHPERVSGLALRAVFLGTRAELDRAFGTVLATFHPTLHRDFLAILDGAERSAPLEAYWRRILDPDPDVHRPAALAWYATERALSELVPARPRLTAPTADQPLPATPFMEAHYFSQDCFLADGALLDGAHRLRGIPGIIVQARYDLLCPPATAEALVARWPEARIEMVEAAGHSLAHQEVEAALRAAVADLAG